MINDIFHKDINKGEIGVFIDDILVGTKVVEGVLRKLEENDLFVKPEKYKWKMREIEFLGVVLGPRVIEMEKVKVKGVLDWPTPKKVKSVQKFLGLANYYRQFIKDFAKVVQPLHVLVRKAEKWRWKKEQKKMFQMLKQPFTQELILVISNLDQEIRVEVDVSNYATRDVLSVKQENGSWRLVAFIFKSLNLTKCNYEIHDKEMLAIIRCLESWRYYLEGARV